MKSQTGTMHDMETGLSGMALAGGGDPGRGAPVTGVGHPRPENDLRRILAVMGHNKVHSLQEIDINQARVDVCNDKDSNVNLKYNITDKYTEDNKLDDPTTNNGHNESSIDHKMDSSLGWLDTSSGT